MKQQPWLPLLLPLLFLLLAGGCLRVEQQYPERMFFALTTERFRNPLASDGPTLRLLPLQVLTPFNRSSFIYRYDTVRFEADYYNHFLSSPERLLHAEMQRWLTASGLFARVLDGAGGRSTEDFFLEGSVSAIYGDYQTPGSPLAVLAIDFALYGNARAALLWSGHYRYELPLAESTAPALAIAWREGLALIMSDLEEDLAQVLQAAQAQEMN
jgi:cholesterol transport system auxiliary component